jgi:pimeloyl-ACP methyl ester carboxylesterase
MNRKEVLSRWPRASGVLLRPDEPLLDTPLLVCVHGGGCNGAYFEVGPHAVARSAADQGWPVLLVDRPGFGRSAPPETEEPIREAAALLPDLIYTALERVGARAVVVIGHSIGGAVALSAVAHQPDLAAAVAVSGIGDAPTAEAAAWFEPVLADDAPAEPAAFFFFGPDGTYGWQGPAALRKAAAPWRRDEVVEVMRDWPDRFGATAAAVRVPVHFRLAEHERLWQAEATALERVRRSFSAAHCDLKILPAGGHLYEFHKRGGELVAAQLSFLALHAGAPAALQPAGAALSE